jgi:phytoene synthase
VLPPAPPAPLSLDAADLLASLPLPSSALPLPASEATDLDAAYRTCAEITRRHSKSFFLSSQLLPPPKRRAVRALYAFCRTSDDLVDVMGGDAGALAAWVALVRAPHPMPGNAVLLAWHDTRTRHAIPQVLVDELLAGIAMDLSVARYPTFADLWVYCYRVASVVGLLAMQIVGHSDGAADYAVRLGVALQLTNILRDVGEDSRRGRIYIPQEDMARFGVTEAEIVAGAQGEHTQALLQFEIQRARDLYESAWGGVRLLSPDSRLAIGAAGEIYRAILGRIEANRYDVFTRRASVPLLQKLQILWRVRARLRAESSL